MFRFTIRDVLWLTVVVALAVGWWVEHRRYSDAHRRLDRNNVQLAKVETALNQTVVAIYDLGFHWQSLNGQVRVRPLAPGDGGRPVGE
jgi:hypothetical protein